MINKKLFASKIGEKKILNVSFLIIVYKCNFPKFYEKGGIRTTLLIKTVQKKKILIWYGFFDVVSVDFNFVFHNFKQNFYL